MKAITVRQPHAHLIAIAKDPTKDKFIENRTWRHPYRGPIAIHAGKSHEEVFGWEDADLAPAQERVYGFTLNDMAFGAIVATAILIAIVPLGELPSTMRDNEHAEGPWLWILDDIKPLAEPIPWTGAQGLFDIPDSVLTLRAESVASRQSSEPPLRTFEELLADMRTLETLYNRDQIAQFTANQIERIFDKWLSESVASHGPDKDCGIGWHVAQNQNADPRTCWKCGFQWKNPDSSGPAQKEPK